MPNIENIKQNTNDFSFTETVASLANNREYKSGYNDLVEGKLTDKAYFWQCLSAVGEEVGSVIYENVLNYINNVANINTCKLRALTSIAKVLGVTEFAILKNLKTVPEDVLKLMDVFSINRSYLLNVNTFNTEFVRDLLSSTLNEETLISAQEQYLKIIDSDNQDDLSSINIFGAISNESYENYVEECFFKLLSKKLFQTYGDDPSDFIYTNLSSQGNFSTTNELAYTRSAGSENGWHGVTTFNQYETDYGTDNASNRPSFESDYSQLIYRYKRSLNVSPGFNETEIVNNIENGTDFLDNYQGGELSVLNLEILERSKAKFSKERGYETNRLNTRYSYYNEKEVRDYVKFIDDMYVLRQTDAAASKSLSEISSSYLNWNPYYLKNNFSPYWLDVNFSNLSLETSATLSSNIETQYQIFTTEISSNSSLSTFIYDYYSNVFSNSVQDNKNTKMMSKFNVVRIVASILKDICLAIVNIRETLKTQSQRNYMTGTKLLIEYILDEYLINMLINTYGTDPEKTKKWGSAGAQIIEYIDTTEYFNIGSLSDEANFEKPGINQPYFENMKDGGFSGSETGRGLVANEIRNFYLSSLNIKSNYISSDEDYYNFMSAVYNVGISKTFVGKEGALCIDKDFLDEDLSMRIDIDSISAKHDFTENDYEFLKNNWYTETEEGYRYLNTSVLSNYFEDISSTFDVLSSDFEKYNEALSTKLAQQSELMLKYHGTDIAYYPWYNYKNQDFPTFQAHPYLYNFVEHDEQIYPIENAFYGNANEDLIYELQSENISVYLGEFGNILRTWRNSNFDYSGYKSRYENSLHIYGMSNANGLYSVTHYDGIFYPPAIDLYKRYALYGLYDRSLGLSGFDLLSAHMLSCVDSGYYLDNDNLDVKDISSIWHYYSHLGLTKAEREHIVNQLIHLSADILEMSDAEYRKKSELHEDDQYAAKPYDVYKYGLDYNNNSIILLKRYANENPTQIEKKNTAGQLWIKLNSHPIGFPAFLRGDLSSYSQVLLDSSKEAVNWNYTAIRNALTEKTVTLSKYGSKEAVANVYDFDLADRGQYLLYAIENPALSEKTYKNTVIISSKILQRKRLNYASPGEEITRYMLIESGPTFLYPTNDGPRNNFQLLSLSGLSESDYEFDGFFQTNLFAYAGYFKRNVGENELLNSISINAIKYPCHKIETYNTESNSFAFLNVYEITPLQTSYAKTNSDALIKLGFTPNSSNGAMFTIAVANEVISNKPQYIQDFIGYNSQKLSSNLSSFDDLSSSYGFTEYIAATSGDADGTTNYDSFDRFDSLITLYDIPTTGIQRGGYEAYPMIYALNSDASYIPLYYGLDGQNLHYKLKDRLSNLLSYNLQWHSQDNNISSDYVPRESMELLGYSYQDFDRLVEDKENTIYKDDSTGKYTSIDSENLLNNALRVYENYISSNVVFEKYNDGVEWLSSESETINIDFMVDLDGLTRETANQFNILLLNAGNGKDRNPILAGAFSEETLNNNFYNTESTKEEESLLLSGYKLDNMAYVVGTPNPFNTQDTTFGLDYTNHIFNVLGLSSELIWPDDNSKPIIRITLKRNKAINFVIQTNELLLFVYKNTLEQFDRYHYMEPTGMFPHNAAISSWNLPWKDKSHAWLYLNEWELSDGWQPNNEWNNVSAYLDKRSPDISNYKNQLKDNAAKISAVVGHMPISAYNSDGNLSDEIPGKLSLMENIELSSLTSFDDNYYLSSGQITWKISEEDQFDYLKLSYPPTLIDSLLYDKFHGTNKEHLDYNIFELSNTYIFQLDDPLSIANKIGKIAIPIGTAADEFTLVYEDYLSDQVNVDVGGVNFLKYCETLFDPSADTIAPDNIDVDTSKELCAVNESLFGINDFNEAVLCAESQRYFPEESERNNKTGTIDYHLLSVLPDDISDYLKIYVNWRKYDQPGHEREIELFFNFPNLFISPYSYRTKDGIFAVEYKPNTYLRLKSGEDGYLYIILQFKYYDATGTLCGIRDLPILTYHIYNVSDDKPKFVVTKTFEIDNRDGKYTYPGDADENIVYVIIDNKKWTRGSIVETGNGALSLDQAIGYDFYTNTDLYLYTNLEILSPIPLKYVNLEMVYERGHMDGSIKEDDPEFVFEPTISRPGTFTEYKGNISAHFDFKTIESKMQFTALLGTKINEDTYSREFPIEIMNAEAEDINGNKPKFVFINGLIELDDSTATDIGTGAYLARELNLSASVQNPEPASQNFTRNAGYILEEQRKALIRMYTIGRAGNQKLLAELPNDILPLKTTGERNSRFDRTNNMFIYFDNGDGGGTN